VDTKVIMAHIETLKDPAGFLEVARRITPKKPILALKTGKTSEGVVAVASHTGSLLDQDTLSDVIFQKSGVLRFHSQEEMIHAAMAFSTQPVPTGERVVIVTNTGGPAIIAVDECVSAGLKLAELSPQTKEALSQILFTEAIVSNPVDVVATAGPDQYGGTVEALLKDPNMDSLLLNFVTPPFVDCEGVARRLGEIGKTAEKPVVCVVMTIEKWDEVIRLIRESGIPVYDYPETASKVLASMTEYGRIVQSGTPEFTPFAVDKARAEEIIGRHRGKDRFLPQGDVYELLRCYGIPTARTVQVRTEEDLKSAAASMQFPVVLKVDAEDIVHKSDVGGVALDIEDEETLLTLFKEMAARFAKVKPGFILQKYLAGGKEVILGVKGNEGLAPTIMFGLGGILVEVMKDVQFRLAPLALEEARDMVRSIQGYPVLEGTRGEPAVDEEKLEEVLARLSQLASDFPEIDEMDLNPVLAFEKGKGAVVVDARLKL